MAFRCDETTSGNRHPDAQAGIRDSFLSINEQAPNTQIDTLERFPERCAYAREREYFQEEIRQIVYRSHRVVFFC